MSNGDQPRHCMSTKVFQLYLTPALALGFIHVLEFVQMYTSLTLSFQILSTLALDHDDNPTDP